MGERPRASYEVRSGLHGEIIHTGPPPGGEREFDVDEFAKSFQALLGPGVISDEVARMTALSNSPDPEDRAYARNSDIGFDD